MTEPWEIDPTNPDGEGAGAEGGAAAFLMTGDQKTRLAKSLQYIKDKFPKVDFQKIGPLGYGKKKLKIKEE